MVGGPAPRRRPPPPFDLRGSIQETLPGVDVDAVVLHLTLMQLGKVVEAPANKLLADDGLETSDRSVLVALLFSGPPYRMSPTQLSTAILQTTSGMSKTLRRLAAEGLVERVPDPSDGRGRLVHLTRAGVERAERQLRTMADHWAQALEAFDPRERAAMADAAWTLLQRLDPTYEPAPPPERHP